MSTAWDISAQELCDEKGAPLQVARDFVIIKWLLMGDTRPFYSWVLGGHEPSFEVVRLVAAMMAKADSPDALRAEVKTILPYGLSIAGKKRGDRSNPELEVRDHFIYREVERKIAVGEKYEAAIAAVHEWLPDAGVSVSHQTVRNAYDTRRVTKSRSKGPR